MNEKNDVSALGFVVSFIEDMALLAFVSVSREVSYVVNAARPNSLKALGSQPMKYFIN